MENKFDLSGVEHHEAIEDIVTVLCNKTENTDRGFFRVEVAYFLAKLASSMRITVRTKDRGSIPINIYTLALATSGYGQGHSVNIMETDFIAGFKTRFLEEAMPTIAEKHIWEIANKKAAKNSTDQQEEFDKLASIYHKLGVYPFTFDSGTTPAVKQLRDKLLLANIGSVNLQIDEIGSNLLGSTEVLNTFLELYDQGMIKQKLIKNTAENQRVEEIDGRTPANMLLFGTPAKLFDGAKTEEEFYSFLETGYARRCLFGFGQPSDQAHHSQTAEEIYNRLINPMNTAAIHKWSTAFTALADPAKYGQEITVVDSVGILLIEYKIHCAKVAAGMKDFQEIEKAEVNHRYDKALKLAGALAFVDGTSVITEMQLKQAILLVEESGSHFSTILNRKKSYVRLAEFIADIGTEQTHADLLEALPFYKNGTAARNEMISLATAWGYKNNIIIKKFFVDGIELFKGETLKKTSLDEMMLSHSDHFAYHYESEVAPFDQLHVLTQLPDHHWCNHSFENEHRSADTTIPGFNMIVLDIDEGVSLSTAQELMRQYVHMTYTTKRHTPENNRFRLILPINYVLEMDAEEYKEMMESITAWLPFKIDDQANQRERKWETFDGGTYAYNLDGEVLDILQFIPKTARNEQYRKDIQKVESLDNLERWFAQRIATGNRNNHMIKYALALVDSGLDLQEVSSAVIAFNQKLNNPLPDTELHNTVLKSVASRMSTL